MSLFEVGNYLALKYFIGQRTKTNLKSRKTLRQKNEEKKAHSSVAIKACELKSLYCPCVSKGVCVTLATLASGLASFITVLLDVPKFCNCRQQIFWHIIYKTRSIHVADIALSNINVMGSELLQYFHFQMNKFTFIRFLRLIQR